MEWCGQHASPRVKRSSRTAIAEDRDGTGPACWAVSGEVWRIGVTITHAAATTKIVMITAMATHMPHPTDPTSPQGGIGGPQPFLRGAVAALGHR